MELALVHSLRDAERKERRNRELLEVTPQHPKHTVSSPDTVLAPLYPTPATESKIDDFIIQEATDMVTLGGFTIMSSDRHL